ncbi:MAG: DUF2332 family protein [Minwuia sp.]|nr:DUF2332 family protein [Minwuia sp.]
MGDLTRRHFERQAEACERMKSPFTAKLLRLGADRLTPETTFAARVLGWSDERMRDDALALRFAGALHACVLSDRAPELAACYPPNAGPDDEALWAAVSHTMVRDDEFLSAFLDHPPQTNETGRAAVLLLGFQRAALDTGNPLAMLELGASAGLNQNWDRFAYDFAGTTWGDVESGVRLAPEWRGRAPDNLAPLEVVRRRGCDLNPLQVADPAQQLRLRSYIWPDQQDRLERMDAAIAIALAQNTRLARANAADWAEACLVGLPKGVTTVIYHSIFWQYMPVGIQESLRSTIEVAGAMATEDAPLAWVRMEPSEDNPEHADLFYTLWPEPERQVLAHCDYHGRWIEPV